MGASSTNRDATRSPAFRFFLGVTVALCGAIVMVLEVLGSRVLGPFFGVSLFVWTSLITVTLVSLALGYAAGGVLADRRGSPGYLFGIVLAAGLCVLAIPHARSPVLKATMALDLRAGSVAAAAILFGPALFLLGCVTPGSIRVAAKEATAIGRTVGFLSAVSTMGSFLGTLLTGFVLIAWFPVDKIFLIVGGVLVLLSATYPLVFLRRLSAALVLAVPLLLPGAPTLRGKTLPNGTKVEVVLTKDGFYGTLKVLDYSHGATRIRELMIDGLIQGGIDTADHRSVYLYPYLMELVPFGINPGGRSCLVLGLGAGVIPSWYEARGIRTDVVDINPDVVDIARTYFDARISGDVIISDARYFLTGSRRKYDYIVVDVANGDWAPAHILSLEAFRLYRERLTAGGILAINLIGSVKNDPLMTASTIATLREVFPTVRAYLSADPGKGSDVQNLAIVACDGPGLFDPDKILGFPVHPMVAASLREVLGRELVLPAGTPSIILTDDYNPGEFFDLRVKEKLRRDILSYTDWDVLM